MTVKEHVAAQWSTLSASHRRVCQWLVNNPEEAVFLNVREVGRRTKTSSATVVRTAQMLGYGGYPALLEDLQSELLSTLHPAARLSATLDGMQAVAGSSSEVLQSALRQDMGSLQETLGLIKAEDFDSAVSLLQRAKLAYVLGCGLSVAPVSTLAFRLRRLGKPVIAITADEDPYTPLLPATEDDLLVVFGFQPVQSAVLRCAAHAKRHGIPVLAVTDIFGSPLQNDADLTLHIKRGPLTQLTSVVAPVAVANALAMACARLRSSEAATAYERLEELQLSLDSGADIRIEGNPGAPQGN